MYLKKYQIERWPQITFVSTLPVCVPAIHPLPLLLAPPAEKPDDVYGEEVKVLEKVERAGKDIFWIKVSEPHGCSGKFPLVDFIHVDNVESIVHDSDKGIEEDDNIEEKK